MDASIQDFDSLLNEQCLLAGMKIAAPVYIASVMSIPAVFIPIVAGDTMHERLLAFIIILPAVLTIVCAGTASGILIRRLLQKKSSSK